jgi:peptidoglycan/xylan/chitin deacetylase (PgdA/CDA1 family)
MTLRRQGDVFGGGRQMMLDKVRRTWARMSRPRVLRDRRAVGMFSICFDDFPKTAWTEGGRVLRGHGVLATYYLCGSLCGSTFDGQKMYDASDLELIHAEGHEIGCHTFDHRSCLRTSISELQRATRANQRFLNEHLAGVRLASFAYPYGDATLAAKRFAVQNFSSARGVNAGLNMGRIDLGQLRSVGFEAAKMGVATIERYIARASARGAWLIIYTHDVQDRPGAYGCCPDDLDRVVRSARAAGLEILPVGAALSARAFARSSQRI